MRIVIILLIVVSLILSIVMSPLVYSLGITAGTCLLLGYWTWRDSKIPKRGDVHHKPEPTEVEEVVVQPSPFQIIHRQFTEFFNGVLEQLNTSIIGLPVDWKYKYILLPGSDGYLLLQKFDNGVVTCRFSLRYSHPFFDNSERYLMCDGTLMAREKYYISPSDFFNSTQFTVAEKIEAVIAPLLGGCEKITFPKSLTIPSGAFPRFEKCMYGINLAYSTISDSLLPAGRETYYDGQALIYQQYKDNLSLIVQDQVFGRLDTIVSDIKTKEASSQVITSDKMQQITLRYTGNISNLISWGFDCILGKNEIIVHGVCLEGTDIEAIFTSDEARTLMLNTAEKLMRLALQSSYPNLEFGPLGDDTLPQKASISITHIK